jgi:hypothetical protein
MISLIRESLMSRLTATLPELNIKLVVSKITGSKLTTVTRNIPTKKKYVLKTNIIIMLKGMKYSLDIYHLHDGSILSIDILNLTDKFNILEVKKWLFNKFK